MRRHTAARIASFGDDSVDSAVKRLSNVEIFAFGGVGYGGVTSKGEIDFNLVLAQPPPIALTAFEKLYATGNPQEKSDRGTRMGSSPAFSLGIHRIGSTCREQV